MSFEAIEEASREPICLIPPNEARVDVVFNHLNKSAADNLLFLFTNSRATTYAPGESGPALKSLLKDISEKPPNVDIKYSKSTIYCFDSEAFRFVVAAAPPNRLSFSDDCKRDYENSWRRGVGECERLFKHIISLPPHKVRDTLSLNTAIQNINLLTKPLADIAKNIADNQNELQIHKSRMEVFKGDIEQLRKHLYIPTVDIETAPLDMPKTVCGDKECCTMREINGVTKTHYKSDCHSPCYLEYDDGNIMGNKGLLDCIAFNNYVDIGQPAYYDPAELSPDMKVTEGSLNSDGKILAVPSQRIISEMCFVCGHCYQSHLHINYETSIKKTKIRDNKKYRRINNAVEAAKVKQQHIWELEAKIVELAVETEIISKSMARFACFLKENALTPFNDAFGDYVRYLIKNEKTNASQTTGADKDESGNTAEKLELLLDAYNRQRQVFKDVMDDNVSKRVSISIDEIDNSIGELCHLKWNGNKIEELLECERNTRVKNHEIQMEVSHELPEGATLFNKIKKYIIEQN
ncbi:unnamed protein product [Oppiella nova]|uniref:DUF8206 domain-containing protein n=1 Tax=Oppiella nova TaxID=334625 RepID=A0A7R9M474_9ACAR|nr:unnamed protein product [Oppiella nova]CAG2170457.1 unnamed protein product [Oppiella nova]